MKCFIFAASAALAAGGALADTAFHSGQELSEKSSAHDRATEGRATGKDLMTATEFREYAVGVVDGMRGELCITAGVTKGQVAAIVKKYVRSHPERWNESAPSLIRRAMNGAFPCSTR